MSRPMTPKTIFTLLAGILIVSAGIAVAISGSNDKAGPVCFQEPSWTNPPPGSGIPVEYYVAEVYAGVIGDTLKFTDIPYKEPKSSFRYEAPCYKTHKIRVAGVGANGKQGPWSNWSPKYIFEPKDPDFPDGK